MFIKTTEIIFHNDTISFTAVHDNDERIISLDTVISITKIYPN